MPDPVFADLPEWRRRDYLRQAREDKGRLMPWTHYKTVEQVALSLFQDTLDLERSRQERWDRGELSA